MIERLIDCKNNFLFAASSLWYFLFENKNRNFINASRNYNLMKILTP